MKTRLAISLVTLATVGLLLGAASRDARSAEPALCGQFTPARLLEDPRIAHQLYGAMSRGDGDAEARFHALVAEMRAVHGCGELDAAPAAAPEAAPRAPRLPPGHPPITGAPASPIFSDDPRIISL
jgi:hypothetical protein